MLPEGVAWLSVDWRVAAPGGALGGIQVTSRGEVTQRSDDVAGAV